MSAAGKSGAPENKLTRNYINATNCTLKKFLESIKYSDFESKYPEISKECGLELRDLYNQSISQLKDSIAADLESLSTEANVFSSLTSLDVLIKKQNDRTDMDTWRPSGNPENDIRDHLYNQKLKHKKCLEFAFDTLKEQNEKLEKKVEENHAEITLIKNEVDDLQNEILKLMNHHKEE